MKLNIYTIFDTASGLYLRPFFNTSDGAALRAFSDIATDPDHEVGKHPEDYSLFRIGIYDDNTAVLTAENRDCIATGLELVSAARNVKKEQKDIFEDEILKGMRQARREIIETFHTF